MNCSATPQHLQPRAPQFPRSQGLALLCVADDEGVGCARAASVSGFFSSVAMAPRPTEQQGDAGGRVHSSTQHSEQEELWAKRSLQWGT